MLSLPQARNAEGQTDGRPIILQGETVEEFEALMRILHPPYAHLTWSHCIQLSEHRLLDDISKIPIATYTQAMRVAAKYSMDDVQDAIVRVINSLPSALGIARLAFIAEFPGHFHMSTFKEVFVQACSTDRRPSGHDLQPLMSIPHLVALMMHYREGIIQPNQAIWNEVTLWHSARRRGVSPQDHWLDEQLESLGLAPFLAVKV